MKEAFVMIGFWAVILCIYFIPTFIAMFRFKERLLPIFVLNFFFGWTLIGWVASLIWALL